MPPDDDDPPASGPERTVLASADALADALGSTPAQSVPADALIGAQLNDLFEVVRFLAEGGMGRVYEGRNIVSGERVAIKVILAQHAANAQFMALFRREASALERIGHDALVKYRALAFDRTRSVHYLAIEYVDGPSMADVLTGEPADPGLVRRVLRRLAQGLHAAHEAGVIHRDLSPDNVLLPGGNIERAKIIDFGIAKDSKPGEKSVVGEAFAGKFGYAAPEVFGKFGRRVGPWTDVYSLGLVMAALARGEPISMGITIVDALDARERVPDLVGIDPALAAILARMLAPDPSERFQTMDEIADAADPRATTTLAPAPAVDSDGSGATSTTGPTFVRAEPAVPADPVKPASRWPILLVAAALGFLLLAGATWLLFAPGPDTSAGPEPAPSDAPSAPANSDAAPTQPLPVVVDWSVAAPQVATALAGLPCADVRIDGPPSDGQVRLTGWRADSTPLPANVSGWRLDPAGVQPIASPSAASCRLIDQLRTAAGSGAESAFDLPGAQTLSLATMPRNAAGNILVDLRVVDRPSGRLLLTVIDDQAETDDRRVVSVDVDAGGFDLAALPFEQLATRYLLVLLSSAERLPPTTAAGPGPGLGERCRESPCKLASSWIDIR